MVVYGFNTEEEENIKDFPIPEPPPTYSSVSGESAKVDTSTYGGSFEPSVSTPSYDPTMSGLLGTMDDYTASLKAAPGYTGGVHAVSAPANTGPYGAEPLPASTWRQDLAADTARLNLTSGYAMGPGGGMPPEKPKAPTVPTLSPYTLPERGTAPIFEAPEWDKSEINRLSREHSAAPIRTLREAYQRVAARLPTNPQSRVLLKDAIAGYGTGLEGVMAGSRRTARGEYSDKYGREYQTEATKYGAEAREFEQDYASQVAQSQQQAMIENQNLMNQYQADYNEFLRTV